SLFFFSQRYATPGALHSFPTRRSSDLQVRPPEHGTQKGVGCAPAPATLLIHLEIGAAEIAAAVEHLHRRDAAFGGGFAEGVDDLPAHARILDAHFAAGAVAVHRAVLVILERAEDRQHLVPAPAAVAELRPVVPVLLLAA